MHTMSSTTGSSARRLVLGVASVAVVGLMAAPGAGAQAAPVAGSSSAVAPAVAAAASAPCIVTGYTLHAEEQMAARNISSDYVENVVFDYCKRATRRKSNSTWQYTDGKIVVSANDNGYVVTVVRK